MTTNTMIFVYRNGVGEWQKVKLTDEELRLGTGTHFHIKCGEQSKFYDIVSDRYLADRKDRKKTFYKFEVPEEMNMDDRYFSVAYIDHRNQDITFDIHSE